MGPVSATASIDAPRERVFELLADLANRPAICDHFIDQFHLQRLRSVGVGAAARFRIPGRRLWMETTIEQVEPPFRISERGRAGRLGRIPAFTVWELVEGTAGGCEATVTFWMEPTHPLDRLRGGLRAERWFRRRWARALVRLKDVVEGGLPVERVRVAGGDRVPATAVK